MRTYTITEPELWICCVGTVVGLLFTADFIQATLRLAIIKRRHRRKMGTAMEQWARRKKGKVLAVERFDRKGEDFRDLPEPSWFKPGPQYRFVLDETFIYMDLNGTPPVWTGPDGKPVWGGYTEEELRQIAAAPGEFIL